MTGRHGEGTPPWSAPRVPQGRVGWQLESRSAPCGTQAERANLLAPVLSTASMWNLSQSIRAQKRGSVVRLGSVSECSGRINEETGRSSSESHLVFTWSAVCGLSLVLPGVLKYPGPRTDGLKGQVALCNLSQRRSCSPWSKCVASGAPFGVNFW